MSTLNAWSVVLLLAVPLLLVLFEWWLIRSRYPWLGLIGAVILLLFGIVLLFNANQIVIGNCPPGHECGDLGAITALLLAYGYGVLAFITAAGHAILWYYRTRVWEKTEPAGLWKPVYWLIIAALLVPLVSMVI